MASFRTTYKNLTGSGQVIAGEGWLAGFYVNSTSSGTIKLYDSLTGAGTVVHNTMTPAAGYHEMNGTHFATGCYATITNTIDVTFKIVEQAN